MTDTSSFFTTHQTRDVPRDQWKRYVLPDPETGEEVPGWTRATTFAATMAEQYGLSIWHQRQVVWGLSRRPDLLTMAQTIAGPEDKKALGAIVDEAHIAAGTKAKANRGSAIHAACHAAERGAFEQVPEELRPHVAGYFKALKEWRLEVIPEYVERTVVVPEYHVAGTFDNLLRCPDGMLRVADKKTGREDYSDVEFAIQMSLYANAKYIFNYDTNRYEPMPEVAKDYAILMMIDPETGVCTPKRINITWGWAWTVTSAQVMAIRKTKNIITPMIPWDDTETSPGVDASPRPDFTTSGAPIGFTSRALQPQTELSAVVNPHTIDTAMVFGTVPGGYVDTTSSVPDEFQAFWSDDRHDTDDEPPTVNGVPLAQYGQPNRWGCSRGEPCEFTGDEGLHSDGTVCLYGNARPGPIPPPSGYEITEQTDVTAEELPSISANRTGPENVTPLTPELMTEAESNVDDLIAAIDGLKGGKAAVQTVARRLMAKLGITEGTDGAIKLSQYKIKIAKAIVTLAYHHGVSIPGRTDADPDFGIPTGPAPSDSVSGTQAPAQKASGAAGAAEVPADDGRAEKIRTAVESINMQTTVAGLQERHNYYSGTSLGWTEEMQSAARTRAAAIDLADGQVPLTPLEMIKGATSRQTLTMAWEKATEKGTKMSGWTEEMQAAANAKQAELAGSAK